MKKPINLDEDFELIMEVFRDYFIHSNFKNLSNQ